MVHASGLLDALAALFESVWQRAIPVPELVSPADEHRHLLMLLASGLKDEAIARQLGIGERTVRRRVAALADRLGARTRMQLGIQAVRQGWLYVAASGVLNSKHRGRGSGEPAVRRAVIGPVRGSGSRCLAAGRPTVTGEDQEHPRRSRSSVIVSLAVAAPAARGCPRKVHCG